MAKTTPLKSITRRSLEDQAVDELRKALISRHFAPGERLTELRLSEQMGISRGTVRAALTKLVMEGLVVQRPYASWEVVGLSERDAWELFTLRAALECAAAEIVTQGVKDGYLDIAPIAQAFAELVRVCALHESDEQVDSADFQFHFAVVSAAGNVRMLTQYERVSAQLQMLIVAANDEPRAFDRLVAEHTPLLDALREGDAEIAGRRFKQHALDAWEDVKARGVHERLAGAGGQTPA